jgi:hypothetical protein
VPVPPRPDSNGFTKFIISAGAFLIVAAVVLPGFVLRDTGVLTISRDDLQGFTPTGKQELERRQTISRDAGHVAPFFGGVLLIGGAILIAIGIPRLKRQEKTADEHARAEVDKLHRELRPQTEGEQEERARAEVKEDEEGAQIAVPASPEEARGSSSTKVGETSRSAYLEHWIKAESAVLARLAEIAPPNYELRSKVKLEEAEGTRALFLDALLISQVDSLPDIVVEIKSASRGLGRNFGNRMAQAESQLLRYLARYRRDSIGWLIFYTGEELTAGQKDALARRTAELADVLKISIVTPDGLASLGLPA